MQDLPAMKNCFCPRLVGIGLVADERRNLARYAESAVWSR